MQERIVEGCGVPRRNVDGLLAHDVGEVGLQAIPQLVLEQPPLLDERSQLVDGDLHDRPFDRRLHDRDLPCGLPSSGTNTRTSTWSRIGLHEAALERGGLAPAQGLPAGDRRNTHTRARWSAGGARAALLCRADPEPPRAHGGRGRRLCARIPETVRTKQAELDAEERRLANFVDSIGEGRGSQVLGKARDLPRLPHHIRRTLGHPRHGSLPGAGSSPRRRQRASETDRSR